MRNPTKAWLVLGDHAGPIIGYELPNIVDWEMSMADEPILWEIINSYRLGPTLPIKLEIHLTNEGAFVEKLPPADADPSKGWTPKTPAKEVEA